MWGHWDVAARWAETLVPCPERSVGVCQAGPSRGQGCEALSPPADALHRARDPSSRTPWAPGPGDRGGTCKGSWEGTTRETLGKGLLVLS